ncbi:MAG: YggS family pyridoxal phosphate-dependent enzyme [Mangrovibacterium sp.]
MSIAENITSIKAQIPQNVCLVAVSKYKPKEDILAAYDAGQRMFGENKVQEIVAKHECLPQDIEWHFIGHLQTNKVKYIAPFISLIHGVDSWKLLKQIDKEAQKNNRIINCLLQFHIAEEETKFGLNLVEVKEMLDSDEFKKLTHIQLCGIMGMASHTDNRKQIEEEFSNLKNIFISLRNEYFNDDVSFKEISMGMSGDYHLAIEQGSTMVRVGSAIFGVRN